MESNTMNKRLLKAIGAILGTAALAGVSGQASAWTSDAVGSGIFTQGGGTQSDTETVPFKAWSDYGATYNMSWAHTSDWKKIQVGSAADIANGATLDVQFKLTGTKTSATSDNTLLWGGFTLWTTGTNPVVDAGTSTAHAYLQTRGPGDGPNNLNIPNAAGTPNGVIDFGNYGLNDNGTGSCGVNGGSCSNVLYGHQGWVGYGNTGLGFTNLAGDAVGGVANGSTGSETGFVGGDFNKQAGSAITGTGSWVDSSQPNTIALNLFGLKAGYYLINIGGTCPDGSSTCLNGNNYAGAGGNARGYTFSVGDAQTAPVPIPAAAWLFGSALAGMGVIGRRKDKSAA
jgi:hypothetical protein